MAGERGLLRARAAGSRSRSRKLLSALIRLQLEKEARILFLARNPFSTYLLGERKDNKDEGRRGLALDRRVRASRGSAESCCRWARRGASSAWQSLHTRTHTHIPRAAHDVRVCPAYAGADAAWGTAGDANATVAAALGNKTKAVSDTSPPALPSCRDNCTECANRFVRLALVALCCARFLP